MSNFSLLSDSMIRGVKKPETPLNCSGGSIRFPVSGHMFDVGDMDRVCFLVKTGTQANALTFQVKQAKSASEESLKDVPGAAVTFSTAEAGAYKAIEVDVNKLDINHDYHFVSLEVTGGTASDFGDILYFGLMPGERPVVQDGASANGQGWYGGAVQV